MEDGPGGVPVGAPSVGDLDLGRVATGRAGAWRIDGAAGGARAAPDGDGAARADGAPLGAPAADEVGPVEARDDDTDWTGRTVDAPTFVDWLLALPDDARSVELSDVRVAGPIELRAASVDVALTFRSCRLESLDASLGGFAALQLLDSRIDGTLDLSEASVRGSVMVSGTDVRGSDGDGDAVLAHGATLGQLFVQNGSVIAGALYLVGCTVRGSVILRRSTRVAANHAGVSLVLDNASVSGALFVIGTGTQLDGGIHLRGTELGRASTVGRGCWIGTDGNRRSVYADGAVLGDDLFVVDHGFRDAALPERSTDDPPSTWLAGGVRLIGAHVSGTLSVGVGDCRIGADGDGLSLVASRATIVEGVILDGPRTVLDGGIQAVGTDVRASLRIDAGVRVGAPAAGLSLDLRRARIGHLELPNPVEIEHGIDLDGAVLNRLTDTPAVWRHAQPYQLGDLHVERIPRLARSRRSADDGDGDDPGAGWTADDRRDWLDRDLAGSRAPYVTIATVYRTLGRDREARSLLEAGARRTARGPRRLLAVIGYGYQPQRAGYLALVVAALFLALVVANGGARLFEATAEHTAGAGPAPWQQAVYALESVVPVVDLGPRADFDLVPPVDRQWLLAVESGVAAIGWVLSSLVVAGFTRVVRHD